MASELEQAIFDRFEYLSAGRDGLDMLNTLVPECIRQMEWVRTKDRESVGLVEAENLRLYQLTPAPHDWKAP